MSAAPHSHPARSGEREPVVTLPLGELRQLIEDAAQLGAERALDGRGGLDHDAHAGADRARSMVDAATLAAELGLTRQTVYQHAAELGGVRVGSGERARWRFDLEAAKAAMGRLASKRSQAPDLAPALASQVVGDRPTRPGGQSSATHRPRTGSVLPIRPRRRRAA
jgi:hypothetical protein